MANEHPHEGSANPGEADDVTPLLQGNPAALAEADEGDGDNTRIPHVEPELAVARIVRPHLFHVAEVSGVVVPIMLACGDEVAGQRRLYLRWKDGRREYREFTSKLELPDGSTLWLSPAPTIQNHMVSQSWSREGRQRFLEGHTPDPAALFRRLCAAFSQFLVFPIAEEKEGAVSVLALWAMLTYAFPAWPSIPYLAVGGSKNSGKTRIFELLTRVVWAPLFSANMTAACLFRTLDGQGGTLLLDEAEQLKSPEAGDLLRLLLSGYKRGGRAQRLESTGDGKFVPREFNVYGLKAIAAIASFPDPLESRCIRLMMFRAPKDAPEVRRRIEEDDAVWVGLRDELHAFALTNGPKFVEAAARTDLCDEFGNRDYELWQPLVALAQLIEESGQPGLVQTIKAFALHLIELSADDQAPEADEILLRHLADLICAGKTVGNRRLICHDVTPAELLGQVRDRHDVVFKLWSAKGVSNALKRYGIGAKKSHGRRSYKHVTLADLRRIERAYGLDLGLGTDPTDPTAPKRRGKLESGGQQATTDPVRRDGTGPIPAGVDGVEGDGTGGDMGRLRLPLLEPTRTLRRGVEEGRGPSRVPGDNPEGCVGS